MVLGGAYNIVLGIRELGFDISSVVLHLEPIDAATS